MPPERQADLREVEESLWHESTRFAYDFMDSVLAIELMDFGRSGRIWCREEILASTGRRIEAELSVLAIRMVNA